MSVSTVQAIINGVTTTLTYNSSNGRYEATITAPAASSYNKNDGHYYPVTIEATDDAGNVTTKDDTDAVLGASLRLTVKEKTAPIITITTPTASALITNNIPTISFTVMDDDSGVNPDTIGVTIDSNKITGDAITKKAISGGYSCSYTPSAALSDGNHVVKVDASDHDGNAAAQKSVIFKIDTVPPTLSVTSPADGSITNNASVIVSGVTNDAASSPVTVTVKLNSGEAEAAEVDSSGTFCKTVTLDSGANTITVVATDGAGKTTTVVRTVTLDTEAPIIHSVTLTPNPVDAGQTYIISVEITD